MLNRHSRLCIPPESHFIVDLDTCLQADWTTKDFRDALSAHPRFQEWEMPCDRLRETTLNAEVDLGKLLGCVYREYAWQKGKVRWGDKTPNYVKHVALIDQIFPTASVVHLIRDGRDVACSLRDVPWFSGCIIDSARLWSRMVELGRRSGESLGGDRYLEITYEDLVRQPETVLRQVCRHLGETYEEKMLEAHDEADIPAARSGWHQDVSKSVSEASIGRWRNDLSQVDLGLFEYFAGQALRDFGYPPQGRFPARAIPPLIHWCARKGLGKIGRHTGRRRQKT